MGKRKHRNSRKGVFIGTGVAMAAMSFAVLQQANATMDSETSEAIELMNGSFEEEILAPWRATGPDYYRILKNGNNGVNASEGSQYLALSKILEQDVPVKRGSQIRFRADYRAAGLTGGAYMVTASDLDLSGYGYEQFKFNTDPAKKYWSTVGGVYTVPTQFEQDKLRIKIGPQDIKAPNPEILVDNFQIEYAPRIATTSSAAQAPVQVGSEVAVESTFEHQGGGALLDPLFSVPLPVGVQYVEGSAKLTTDGAAPTDPEGVEVKNDGRLLEIKPGTSGKISSGTYKVSYKVKIGKQAADTFELRPTLFHQWASKDKRDQDMAVPATAFTVARSDAQFVTGAGGFEKERYVKGEEAVLEVPVTNSGPQEAQNVIVRIDPRNGIEKFVGTDGTCIESASSAGGIECSITALPVGETKVFKIRGRVSGTGTIQAQASLAAGSRQAERSQSYASSVDNYSVMQVTTTVLNAKGEAVDSVEPGEELTFKTTLENSGPDKAGKVTVSLDLPDGLEPKQPLSKTWDAGDLEPGKENAKELVFTAKAPVAAPQFSYAATVTKWVGQDNSPERKSASTVKVNRNAKLDASVSVGRGTEKPSDPVVPGAPLAYTVKITNNGPSPAEQVVVSQTLPPGFSPDPTYPPHGIRYDGNDKKWTVDSLPAGQSVELTLEGRVLPDHPSLTYGARIEGASVPDLRAPGGKYGELDNHRVSQTTAVTQQAEMNVSVVRSKPKAEARPGEEAVWTVTASNGGPSTARSMEIANQLPEGVTLTSAKDADGGNIELEGADHLWKPPALEPGASATLTVTGTVPADRDTLAFVSSVKRAGTADVRGAIGQVPQHKAADSLKVVQQADLDVTLTPGASGFKTGEKGTMTVTVSNAGPSAARSATAELALPDNLTGITGKGSGTFDARTGTWHVGDLKPGDKQSLTLAFTAEKEQESTFSVLALASNAEDPNACVDVCASATAHFTLTGEAPAPLPSSSAGGAGADGSKQESPAERAAALAATGSDARWWGIGALGTLGVGAALLGCARRRRN